MFILCHSKKKNQECHCTQVEKCGIEYQKLQKEGMIVFKQFQSYLIELVKEKFVLLKIHQVLAWCSECTQECFISKLMRIKRGNIEFQAWNEKVRKKQQENILGNQTFLFGLN